MSDVNETAVEEEAPVGVPGDDSPEVSNIIDADEAAKEAPEGEADEDGSEDGDSASKEAPSAPAAETGGDNAPAPGAEPQGDTQSA